MMRMTARIIDNPKVIEVLATSHALQRWWDAPPPARDGRKLEDAVWRGAMSPVLEEDPPASDSGFFSFTEAPGSPLGGGVWAELPAAQCDRARQ